MSNLALGPRRPSTAASHHLALAPRLHSNPSGGISNAASCSTGQRALSPRPPAAAAPSAQAGRTSSSSSHGTQRPQLSFSRIRATAEDTTPDSHGDSCVTTIVAAADSPGDSCVTTIVAAAVSAVAACDRKEEEEEGHELKDKTVCSAPASLQLAKLVSSGGTPISPHPPTEPPPRRRSLFVRTQSSHSPSRCRRSFCEASHRSSPAGYSNSSGWLGDGDSWDHSGCQEGFLDSDIPCLSCHPAPTAGPRPAQLQGLLNQQQQQQLERRHAPPISMDPAFLEQDVCTNSLSQQSSSISPCPSFSNSPLPSPPLARCAPQIVLHEMLARPCIRDLQSAAEKSARPCMGFLQDAALDSQGAARILHWDRHPSLQGAVQVLRKKRDPSLPGAAQVLHWKRRPFSQGAAQQTTIFAQMQQK